MFNAATQPFFRNLFIVTCIVVLVTPLALVAQRGGGKSTMASQRVVIPGHLVPALKGQHALASPALNQTLSLVVGLNLRNRSTLDGLLKTQDDPHSKLFHHYLTPQQFTADFGPLLSTTQAVSRFLTSQGVHVTSVSANHAFISATGSVQAVDSAFATSIVNYAYHGRLVYAPTKEPSVPSTLAGMIQGISGLDDVAQGHHLPLPKADPHQAVKTHQHPTALGCPTSGYYPADFWDGYDMRPLVNYGYDGVGQSVAVVEFDGYAPNDVATYDTCAGLSSLNYSLQYNANGYTAPLTSGDGAEADLDMEVLQGITPSAQQLIYIGHNEGNISCSQTARVCGANFVTGDIINIYNHIVTDNLVTIASVSWGLDCEGADQTANESMLDTVLTQGAAQGIAFLVGSGDSGAHDCISGALGIDELAADPHVLSVGGTSSPTLGLNETAWNNTKGISGGGLSQVFPTPFYQNYLVRSRGVPDVAADADPVTGYVTYCSVVGTSSQDQYSCAGWNVRGGTSAATPLWAGVLADINDYLGVVGKPTLGAANTLLYLMYTEQQHLLYPPYHDITTGNNGYYSAGAGYDLVTGLGTPDVWNLTRDLVATIATNLESDAVWGATVGSSVDLMMAFNQSSTPGWQLPTDVSSMLRTLHAHDSTAFDLSLLPNEGKPGLVSYQTSGDGTLVDVFFLATVQGFTEEYGASYVPATGAWSDLGTIASTIGSNHVPLHNPAVIALGSPTYRAVATFGITSSGDLIESYLSNSARQSNGQLQYPWSFTDITQQTGVRCDAGIDPAAVNYNGVAVVFADCSGTLVEFYPNHQGYWQAQTNLPAMRFPFTASRR